MDIHIHIVWRNFKAEKGVELITNNKKKALFLRVTCNGGFALEKQFGFFVNLHMQLTKKGK